MDPSFPLIDGDLFGYAWFAGEDLDANKEHEELDKKDVPKAEEEKAKSERKFLF